LGPPSGKFANGKFANQQMKKSKEACLSSLFIYRFANLLLCKFTAQRPSAATLAAMTTIRTVAVAGSTGFVGRAIVRELPDQPGDVPQTYADVSKAEKLLGYRPQTAIREGVAKYVEWYRLSRCV
jgi:hypothetical protein